MSKIQVGKSYAYGNSLTSIDQEKVKRMFVNRYTCKHVPTWAMQIREDSTYYAPQYINDADWLAHTQFKITNTGNLDMRYCTCLSSDPTWPLGQSLKSPFNKSN
jgi:hypothetical protein